MGRSAGTWTERIYPRLSKRRHVARTPNAHQGISLRSRKNFPVSFCGASLASHTMVSAPSSTERVAFDPPISVRTQPGQTEFTANFGNAVASCDVTPSNAVIELQYAAAQPSAPPASWTPPLDTLTTRGAFLFRSDGANWPVTRSGPRVLDSTV